MSVYLRGTVYWYKFRIAGQQVCESAKTPRKTVAVEAERIRRAEMEKTFSGIPMEKRETRIQSVRQKILDYSRHYGATKRQRSVQSNQGRMKPVLRILGHKMLGDLSADVVRAYMEKRLEEGVSGRTVNMELGELSRAIGRKWSLLWPNVKKLEERKDVGRALSSEEEARLFAAADNGRSVTMPVFLHVALLTTMRSGCGLSWGQIDLKNHTVTVGRAKTSSGTGRQIPLNEELLDVLVQYRDWYVERFGEARPN